jgi:RNA-directed DNA polymerase
MLYQRWEMLADLAQQYNLTIRGWWNYYGAFYRTATRKLSGYIDRKLEQWARRKYKTLTRHKQPSAEWLRKMKELYPTLFFHWHVGGNRVG